MPKIKLKHSYYKAATPEKLRKIGDAILIAGPLLQAAIMNLPLSDITLIWINFSISIASIFGKIITNFFIEDSHVEIVEKSESAG